ncbi:acyltransferase family protein [Pseudomonas sp. PDM13]|uniref:acyltransferase family protein n=1 Tax=Pseudomonas sp. PDM13 TaxID=2769255 RepID=UPI0021E0F27A|nr:acyltransferase [Pseudomonas sp. PDM13]MCU9951355.1 acyltransferase [Pseudomonas sp. PDM13]
MLNRFTSDYLLLLRVIASHVVVAGHAASYFGIMSFSQWPNSPYFQSSAVIVFFFLSGFTIAWLCDCRRKDSGYSYQNFLFDRACRIFIPLIPVLILYAVLEYFFYRSIRHPYPYSYNLETFIANVFLLLPQPFSNAPFGTNRPLWSVAQEWWLYIFYGLLALSISKTHRYVKWGLLGLFCLSISFTVLDIAGRGKDLGIIWFIGAGTWLLTKNTVSKKIPSYALAGAATLTTLLIFVHSLWPEDGTYSVAWNLTITAPLVFTTLLASRLKTTLIPKVATGTIEYMSQYSYTLYLSHYPLMEFIYRTGYFKDSPWLGFFAVTLGSLVLALSLASVFEFRYKQYRNFLWTRIAGFTRSPVTTESR